MNKLSLLNLVSRILFAADKDQTRPQQPRRTSPALTDLRLVFSIALITFAFFFCWTAFVQASHVSPAASNAIVILGHPLTPPSGPVFTQKPIQEIKTGRKTVLPYLTKLAPKTLGESVSWH